MAARSRVILHLSVREPDMLSGKGLWPLGAGNGTCRSRGAAPRPVRVFLPGARLLTFDELLRWGSGWPVRGAGSAPAPPAGVGADAITGCPRERRWRSVRRRNAHCRWRHRGGTVAVAAVGSCPDNDVRLRRMVPARRIDLRIAVLRSRFRRA